MNYDIIGDIHGHAGALTALLDKLGYRERAGTWQQPDHTAIFVGDFIDRGPGQMETVKLVRSMVDHGSALAVMGNHEFNALAWHTADPTHAGGYLRPHSDKNHRQHAAFLEATQDAPALRQDVLDWFMTLPLWLDLPALRVVHACWHPAAMAELDPKLRAGHRLDEAMLHAACRRGSSEFAAIEAILKGPEVRLPDGMSFQIGDDVRHEARTRWWDDSAITYRETAIVDPATRPSLPDLPIPQAVRVSYDNTKPVFLGHYWMTGEPAPLSPRVACVDYSAGRGDPLVAYCWRGEKDLLASHFVSAA